MNDADPRARQDGLGWVTRAVFPDDRLRLTTQPADPPAGWVVLARYAVVPSLDAAKFLLPLVSRKVTAASVRSYNALRPTKVRASRAVIGALARAGLLGALRTPTLTVLAPSTVDVAGVLLTEAVAGALGLPGLHAAIGIRPPDPHHKPTLQLFDGKGHPRGYAKIGWNAATRAMVRAEAAALREVPRVGGDFPDVPRLTLHTVLGEREVAIVAPMPAGVRRLRHPYRPRLDAMLAVARRGGAAAPAVPLKSSPFPDLLRERAVNADPAIRDAVEAFVARDGDVTLEFGDWHGDWVPWNLGRHRGRLLAWDWENRGSCAPVGFDLAHQLFQVALSTHRQPATEAAEAMAAGLDRYGPALGLDPTRQRTVGDAYLIELWLRTYELATGGAGWNRKLHPSLLDILSARFDPPS